MSTEQDRLSYALAKQVPAMERGFTISTATEISRLASRAMTLSTSKPFSVWRR